MLNFMRRSVVFGIVLLVSACSQLPDVRNRDVPTAMFLFFEKDSDQFQPDSEALLAEAAAFLTQYDNTAVKIVSHIAHDENPGTADDPLDRRRSIAVLNALVALGVQQVRIKASEVGLKESLVEKTGEPDHSIDRRVDLLFGIM
jgi:outer membrane protein OmpA-like peptidoglycan-associated protein